MASEGQSEQGTATVVVCVGCIRPPVNVDWRKDCTYFLQNILTK